MLPSEMPYFAFVIANLEVGYKQFYWAEIYWMHNLSATYNCLHICTDILNYKRFLFCFSRLNLDSDSTEADATAQDMLTCGTCQKVFALSDIVKFIQHKVLQCNKENYGQCSNQGKKTFHLRIFFFFFLW